MITGILLFTEDGPIFRVYSEDKKTHQDYQVMVDDLPVLVKGDYYVLNEENKELTYKGSNGRKTDKAS